MPLLQPKGIFRHLINQNSFFFTGFVSFLVVGGLILGFSGVADAVFFFSDHRTYWGDLFFRYFTLMGEGHAFIGATLLLLFLRYRYALTIPVLGLVVTVVTALTKSVFAHDRPYLYFRKTNLLDQVNLVEGVTVHGGANSFPSGHTMAAFALYAFLAFCLPRKKGLGLLLLLVAVLVGVSRVYLVQHFLKDIYAGAIFGVLLAAILYYGQSRLSQPWLDRSLTFKRKPQMQVP